MSSNKNNTELSPELESLINKWLYTDEKDIESRIFRQVEIDAEKKESKWIIKDTVKIKKSLFGLIKGNNNGIDQLNLSNKLWSFHERLFKISRNNPFEYNYNGYKIIGNKRKRYSLSDLQSYIQWGITIFHKYKRVLILTRYSGGLLEWKIDSKLLQNLDDLIDNIIRY